MRLDSHNDLASARFVFHTRKLAKSQPTFNITPTKPVTDSIQIVRIGIIERNLKQLSQYSEAIAARTGVNYAAISLARNSLSGNLAGQMFERFILTGVPILLKNLATFTDGTAFRGVTKQKTL